MSNSVSISYFEQKLMEAFYNINLNKKSISLVLGEYSSRKTLFDHIHTAYGFKYMKITNENDEGLIEYIQILVFDSCVIINIVEYTNAKNNKTIYNDVINIIRKYINHNACINNLIVLLDNSVREDKFYEKKHDVFDNIAHVTMLLELTLPVYFICDVFTDMHNMQTFVHNIGGEMYLQCIGVCQNEYNSGGIYYKLFEQQIKQTVKNIYYLCFSIIENNNNIEDNILLTTVNIDVNNIIQATVENICSAFNRISNNNHLICRYILFTGQFYFEGQHKYLFLDFLFNKILFQERNLVHYNIKTLESNKNPKIEIILGIFIALTFCYNVIAMSYYIGTMHQIIEEVKYNNTIISKDATNDIEIQEQLINCIKRLHLLYVNRSIANIYYILDNYYCNTNDTLINYIETVILSFYNTIKNEIIHNINKNLNYQNMQSLMPEEIHILIRKEYEIFWSIINYHNNITNGHDVLTQLHTLFHMIHHKESKFTYISDNYVIRNYKHISITDFNTYIFAKNVLQNALEEIEKTHPIHKIEDINTHISLLLTNTNTEQTLRYLKLVHSNIIHTNLNEVKNAIYIKECFELINELKAIGYINDLQFKYLDLKLQSQVKKYYERLNNIENKLIDKLVQLHDEDIVYTPIISTIEKRCGAIINSDIYKRLITHLEATKTLAKKDQHLIVFNNLNGILMIMQEYEEFNATLENNYIDNEFNKIFNRLINTELEFTISDSIFAIGPVFQSEDKFLNYMCQHMRTYYQQYNTILQKASGHQFLSLTNKVNSIFTDYINVIYNKLLSQNTLRELVNTTDAHNNYFGYLFDAANKTIFSEKLDKAIQELSTFAELFSENIFLLKQYSHLLFDTATNKKLEYLINFIQQLEYYKKDKVNSLLGKIKKELLEHYTTDDLIFMKWDKTLNIDKSYLSHVYKTLVDKYNANIIRNRHKLVDARWVELKTLCTAHQDKFPISLTSTRKIDMDILQSILDTATDILDLVISYNEDEETTKYDKIISQLYYTQSLSNILETPIPIDLHITLSKNLDSIAFIKIITTNNATGETTTHQLEEYVKEINTYINMDSSIDIILGALMQNLLDYKEVNQHRLNTKEHATIRYTSPSYLDIITHALENNNKLSSTMIIEVVIPILTTELSINKATYVHTETNGYVTIKVFCHHKLIKALKEFNEVIHNIIKDKII